MSEQDAATSFLASIPLHREASERLSSSSSSSGSLRSGAGRTAPSAVDAVVPAPPLSSLVDAAAPPQPSLPGAAAATDAVRARPPRPPRSLQPRPPPVVAESYAAFRTGAVDRKILRFQLAFYGASFAACSVLSSKLQVDENKAVRAPANEYKAKTKGALVDAKSRTLSYQEALEHRPSSYQADYLDDPSLLAGKNRVVMRVPGARFSIIPFVKPRDLAAELNEQFFVKHEWLVEKELTLSKIRSLKLALLAIGVERELSMSTVAYAYVYFERLTLRGRVNKGNRRLVAAVCLLLAFKINEKHSDPAGPLVEATERKFGVTAKAMFHSEFAVMADLRFALHAPLEAVYPHYLRIYRYCDDHHIPCPQWVGMTTYAALDASASDSASSSSESK